MLHIIQFEGSNVTAKDDATLYNYLLNGDSGVISGFECRVTSSNNISISDGELIIKGRMITSVDTEITAELYNSSSIGKGRIYLEVDTTKSVDEAVKIKSVANSSLPNLIQQDINKSETIYQFELATYDTTNLGLSNLQNTADKLSTQKEQLDYLTNRIGKSVALSNGTIGLTINYDNKWYYNKCGNIVNFESKYIDNVNIPGYKAHIIGRVSDKPILDQMHLATNKHLSGSLMITIRTNGDVLLDWWGNGPFQGEFILPSISYLTNDK